MGEGMNLSDKETGSARLRPARRPCEFLRTRSTRSAGEPPNRGKPKYRDADAADTAEPTIVTAPLPPQTLPRALASPSLLAHIPSDTFCDGLPFHRQECMA
ncbi:conserved uncharacterized protein [Stigmatella aurantiaca DW4/3-1]|uniref:Conserved uncharacterized protein n=1 Tax=Stigmatella aurantiaca (strain DW4/3-1) TaxID=378806 RepID=E3FLA7_STIAD|nr:conserved uncharacterized protein [Stigmatella aurantiaca DW4/3-1]